MIEIKLKENVSEKVIVETLSRMGIASKKEKIVWPSVYFYEENDIRYLAHFKELFALRDNGYNNVSEQDLERRNSIAYCLYSWGLIEVDETLIEPHNTFVFVLPYNEKNNWTISHKIKMRHE